MQLLGLFAILAAGMMVGSEFAVAVFVHPTLSRLPDRAHFPSAAALARVLGKYMPFWYAAVALLSIAETAIHWHAQGSMPPLLFSASLLFSVCILVTILFLVPINERVASWTDAAHLGEWKADRRKWDLLHRWRVVALTLALFCLIAGLCGRSGA